MQLGVATGFGTNLSPQGAFDTDFHGNESLGLGAQRAIDPTHRVQAWAIWDWSSGLRASLGYTGMFAGASSTVFSGASYADLRNANLQRIRAETAYMWIPRRQSLVEVADDIQATGGYQLGIGVTARLRLLF